MSIGRQLYPYLVAFVAAVGGFLFGYDLSIISGAQIYLRQTFQLDAAAFGFAVASAILGCMAGPIAGIWVCDAIGRKKTLMLSAGLFGASAIGTALPRTIAQFYIFRIIGGVGVGLASVVSPMYIAEMAPARIRGRLVTMNQLAIVVGSLSAILAANFLAQALDEAVSWRWMFGSELVPIVLFVVFLIGVPESPRWLASKGREAEAQQVLARIIGPEQAEQEMGEITGSLAGETGGFAELFQPGLRIALLLGVFVALMQQWTGWSVISFYMPTIFQKAGFSAATDALFQSIVPNVGNLIFTFVGLYLVDRVGRRPLWLAGSLLMTVFTAALGVVFATDTVGWLVVLVVSLCALPHAVAFGPLGWLLIAEIFPTRIRARAMGLASLCVWLAAYIANQLTPLMSEFSETTFGNPSATFFLFSGICVVSFFVGLRLVPETKGKTLEEIARFWISKSESPPDRG